MNEAQGNGGHPELSGGAATRGTAGVSANGFNSNPFGGQSTTGAAHYLRDWAPSASIYDGPNGNYTVTVGDHRRMSPDRSAASAAATAAAVGISPHALGIPSVSELLNSEVWVSPVCPACPPLLPSIGISKSISLNFFFCPLIYGYYW